MSERKFFAEDIGPRFAELLTLIADEYSAPIFAADLAEAGCNPQHLREAADDWEKFTLEPPEFAASLRAFADDVDQAKPR